MYMYQYEEAHAAGVAVRPSNMDGYSRSWDMFVRCRPRWVGFVFRLVLEHHTDFDVDQVPNGGVHQPEHQRLVAS